MGMTYAIGDLHGRVDVLKACIKAVSSDKRGKKKKTIVFLGDYIDRGPASRQIIEILMHGPQDKTEWVIIAGNHEMMCLMAHSEPTRHWEWWIANGGLETMISYSGNMPFEHQQWLYSLPDRHEDAHRAYVHAGIKDGISLSEQSNDVVLWSRYERNRETELPGMYVVHGHTPFKDGPVVLKTRCNLDTKAYRTGRMGVAVFDDDIPGAPVDIIEVKV